MYFEIFNTSVIVYEISSKCDIWFYLPCIKTSLLEHLHVSFASKNIPVLFQI